MDFFVFIGELYRRFPLEVGIGAAIFLIIIYKNEKNSNLKIQKIIGIFLIFLLYPTISDYVYPQRELNLFDSIIKISNEKVVSIPPGRYEVTGSPAVVSIVGINGTMINVTSLDVGETGTYAEAGPTVVRFGDRVLIDGHSGGSSGLWLANSEHQAACFLGMYSDTEQGFFCGSQWVFRTDNSGYTNVMDIMNAAGGFCQGEDCGINDDISYIVCTSSDCSTQCKLNIKGGLIVGCTEY